MMEAAANIFLSAEKALHQRAWERQKKSPNGKIIIDLKR
jgi:hypothetical protein